MSDTAHDLTDDELAALTAEQESDDDLVKKLRKQLKTAGKELRDLRPLKGRVAEIELDNSLSKAFDNDEIGKISAEKRTAMLAIAGDDKSPESLRKAAETLGFVEAKPDPKAEELAGHERIEKASTGAGASAATKLDAAAVSQWAKDKQMRFMQQHPDAWEQIKQGEAVTGVTF